MFLIPFDRFCLSSPIDAATLRARLAAATKSRKMRGSVAGQPPFEGRVSDDGFAINLAPAGRNTYRPCLRGRIVADPNGGSIIKVTMSTIPTAMVFVLGLFGWVGVQLWRVGASLWGVLLGFLVFHVVMYLLGYLPEARRARRRFEESLLGIPDKRRSTVDA
jgi:hypothetical protein